jgi:hypothetical protein
MKTALLGVAALFLAVSTASADVQLTMKDGRVSLVAKDATVRQILIEWARVGQTKIVNVERVPGPPVTLQLIDVPEAQALEVLLRSLSGYIAAPRAVQSANLSRYDRIILMPTLASTRPATSAPAPVFQQTAQFNQPPEDDGDDDKQASPAGAPAVRAPVFNSFPQPQVVAPQAAPSTQPGGTVIPPAQPTQGPPAATPPATYPGMPTAPYGGVAVPGMVAPPPPAAPGTPGQPVRRPGGPGGQ